MQPLQHLWFKSIILFWWGEGGGSGGPNSMSSLESSNSNSLADHWLVGSLTGSVMSQTTSDSIFCVS